MRKKKVVPARKKTLRKMKGGANNGALYVMAILGILLLFGVLLVGGATPEIKKLKNPAAPGNPYLCCDSGDGDACHPITENQITYNGDAYGLLKSNILQPELADFPGHVVPAEEKTPDGKMIFLNNTFEINQIGKHRNKTFSPESRCGEPGMDLVWMSKQFKAATGTECFGVPDDQIIYVCKASAEECAKMVNKDKLPFDAYFRLKDGPVPSAISTYCPKPLNSENKTGQQQVIEFPTPSGTPNLQLETFLIKEEQITGEWLSAWCKPAINLYPAEKTNVHVEVMPKGEFTLTIPQYPNGGWNVTAYPDGRVVSGGTTYPYLYWEASIPDSLLTQPKTGYVVAFHELAGFFADTLPRMGLNKKEVVEFSEYWLKALPQSPYYYIGVLEESKINELAPLSITPKPDSLLRVSLHFKALDKPVSVIPPTLSGFERNGFTVTEWGGFFKADKNHPGFTCMM